MNYDFPYDLDKGIWSESTDMSHKLFCTFTTLESLEDTVEQITEKYDILFNKVFILQSKDQNEYICTYNVDPNAIDIFPENTILVHRKKESNTLYTINALNELIKELNGGVLDKTYKIN
ncbi:MAG: hypothetical protein ACO3UU_17235, partial [Minisyncoccia bacterium]